MNGGSLWKLGLSINAPLADHSLNAFASDYLFLDGATVTDHWQL